MTDGSGNFTITVGGPGMNARPGTYVVLAALAVLIGITRFKRLSGLRKTRSTVSDDLAMIKREDSNAGSEPSRAR